MWIDDTPISWPVRCLKCGTVHDLTTVEAYVSGGKTISMALFGWRVSGDYMQLPHPICAGHHAAAAIAHAVIRKSPAATALRWCSYLAVFMMVGFLGSQFRRSDLNVANWTAGGWAVTLATAYFFLVMACKRWSPLRLTKYDEGIVDMVFSDERYAAEFVAANPEKTDPFVTQRRPWYKLENWGVIILSVMAISLLAVLLFGRQIGDLLRYLDLVK